MLNQVHILPQIAHFGDILKKPEPNPCAIIGLHTQALTGKKGKLKKKIYRRRNDDQFRIWPSYDCRGKKRSSNGSESIQYTNCKLALIFKISYL